MIHGELLVNEPPEIKFQCAETSRIRDVDRDSKIRLDKLDQEFEQDYNLQSDFSHYGRVFPRSFQGNGSTGLGRSGQQWRRSSTPGDDRRRIVIEANRRWIRSYIPVFSGTSNRKELLNWVDRVDRLFEEIQPPADLKYELAYSAFEGEAEQWWRQLQHQRFLEGEPEIRLWPWMKFLLLNNFRPVMCSTKCATGIGNGVQELHFESYVNKREDVNDLKSLGVSEIIYDNGGIGTSEKSKSSCSTMEGTIGHNQLQGKFLDLEPLNLVDGYKEESETEQANYKVADLGMVEELGVEAPIVSLPKSIGHLLKEVLNFEGSTNNVQKSVLPDEFGLKVVGLEHKAVSVGDRQPYDDATIMSYLPKFPTLNLSFQYILLPDGNLSFIFDPGGNHQRDPQRVSPLLYHQSLNMSYAYVEKRLRASLLGIKPPILSRTAVDICMEMQGYVCYNYKVRRAKSVNTFDKGTYPFSEKTPFALSLEALNLVLLGVKVTNLLLRSNNFTSFIYGEYMSDVYSVHKFVSFIFDPGGIVTHHLWSIRAPGIALRLGVEFQKGGNGSSNMSMIKSSCIHIVLRCIGVIVWTYKYSSRLEWLMKLTGVWRSAACSCSWLDNIHDNFLSFMRMSILIGGEDTVIRHTNLGVQSPVSIVGVSNDLITHFVPVWGHIMNERALILIVPIGLFQARFLLAALRKREESKDFHPIFERFPKICHSPIFKKFKYFVCSHAFECALVSMLIEIFAVFEASFDIPNIYDQKAWQDVESVNGWAYVLTLALKVYSHGFSNYGRDEPQLIFCEATEMSTHKTISFEDLRLDKKPSAGDKEPKLVLSYVIALADPKVTVALITSVQVFTMGTFVYGQFVNSMADREDHPQEIHEVRVVEIQVKHFDPSGEWRHGMKTLVMMETQWSCGYELKLQHWNINCFVDAAPKCVEGVFTVMRYGQKNWKRWTMQDLAKKGFIDAIDTSTTTYMDLLYLIEAMVHKDDTWSWQLLCIESGVSLCCILACGRAIPWEDWNDENSNTKGKFIVIQPCVVTICSCLSILYEDGNFKKILKLFHKLVNGLDPPKDFMASFGDATSVSNSPSEPEQLEDEFLLFGERWR